MITRVKLTTSTANATNYLLARPEGHAEIIGGTIAHDQANSIAAEFQLSEGMGNARLKRPGYHLVLSYPHGEVPDNERMRHIAEEHFGGMMVTVARPELLEPDRKADYDQAIQDWKSHQAGKYQYLIVRHNDTDHAHSHVIASRVNLETGKSFSTWRDRYRSQMVARSLEKDYGLTQQPSSWEVNQRENRHKQTVLQEIGNQYLNEIEDEQLARVDQVKELVRELPDGKWHQYSLQTDKCDGATPLLKEYRALYKNQDLVVQWSDQAVNNYGITLSDIQALQDWVEEQKRLTQKEQGEEYGRIQADERDSPQSDSSKEETAQVFDREIEPRQHRSQGWER